MPARQKAVLKLKQTDKEAVLCLHWPGSDFTVNVDTPRSLGHLTQVHLAVGLDVHNRRSVDRQSQGQTGGSGHSEAAVHELNDGSRKHRQWFNQKYLLFQYTVILLLWTLANIRTTVLFFFSSTVTDFYFFCNFSLFFSLPMTSHEMVADGSVGSGFTVIVFPFA